MNVNGSLPEREWKSGLFNCCFGWDSTIMCLQGNLTPCWLYGDNMHVLRSDGCFWPCFLCCHFPCCGACYAADTRQQIRQMYGIKEGPCSDKFVWTACSCCATCQEAKELQAHASQRLAAKATTNQSVITMPPGPQAMDSKAVPTTRTLQMNQMKSVP